MMMGREQVIKIDPKGQVEHLRTKKPAEPRLLDGKPIKVADAEDPRKALADWMTSPDNPYFARAMANWVWAQFFGKGLADPPDDLSRAEPAGPSRAARRPGQAFRRRTSTTSAT